ncbi:TRAP transporter, 4TM/12TM fusion protein [Haloterrigena turkmenica DSM 5511]|uniref:TRAP transporter, 4TM/12TM fusion protein n=1 Tax=Haloterrigena turkmenica (strain ATCC 51198 / DSM 5511 / JCM 9101 / NCIMB 13204 / VKM B-1734 / 4k) TaxID=543526 RepID=D2RTH0_HALTV|nr:TRAP transporter fused permease subunit [Haloterrigena turkmenica]ADB59013.1 TRAP transporter, 4TM/12TM fusion protein [Haloterrigena turkmenica DSM 5511]
MSIDTSGTDTVSDEQTDEVLEEIERRRTLRGPAAVLVALIGISFSAFQMWIAARGRQFGGTLPVIGEFQIISLQQLQVNAIHVTFALVLAFLLFPASEGDGFVAQQLGRIPPAVRDRLGADHAVSRAITRLGDGVRWAVVDPSRDRITPLDVAMIALALWPAYYITTEFDEIRSLPIIGLENASAIHELYPWLEPLVVPLASMGLPVDFPVAYLLGIVGILLVLEATRRTLGVVLMGLVASFIVYARWGYMIPSDSPIGALAIQVIEWDNIVYNLWYTVEAGVFSTPVSVSVRFIYIFILFGAFLEMSGAGKWFIDLAYSMTGTRKGGPAKASVVSSGFMGMLSGSSIANTVTTGAFTIPLMKRSGYSPEFSGAVESSASSGGQILPPVMGAVAFLMVQLIGEPYSNIIIAATIPAFAFFFGMWVMVHFEAVKGGIGGIPRAELPDVSAAIRTGWFYLIPLVLLVYFLVIARFSINRAGWYTIVTITALIAVVAAYNERTRLPLLGSIAALYLAQAAALASYGVGLGDAIQVALGLESASAAYSIRDAAVAAAADLGLIAILVSLAVMLARPRGDAPLLELDEAVDDAATATAASIDRPALARNTGYRFGAFILKSMDSGARTATTVVVAVAAAGVVPGVISVSGLGPNLAALINTVSGGSMLMLLVLTGLASIIFGMGMPTTAMYIILIAMLGGPIEDMGVWLVAAHLFVLYFGLMADVTPPVAVAAFAGAGVAKADELKTASIAFLLSLNKILVPFAFVFSPGIVLARKVDGEWGLIGWSDVADVGFFLPEVIVPVIGMFVGVYALGVTIIGYQYSAVDSTRRALYAVASILLMVPEIPLLVVEGALALAGLSIGLTGLWVTVSLRLLGLAILASLSYRNYSRLPDEQSDPAAPTAGNA